MISQWQVVRDFIDGKSLREKAILALLLLATIFAIANFFLFSPLEKEREQLRVKLHAVQTDIKKFSAQEEVLAKALRNDPNAAKKRKIAALTERVEELDNELQALSVGLIPADKLPLALHQVLHSVGSLSLIAMEIQTPTRLSLQNLQEATYLQIDGIDDEQSLEVAIAEPDPRALGVFKHTVAVSLEGKYFDLVRYLQALETLTWKVYWENLDYEVTEYPEARVVLEVYTLSTEAGIWGA